MEMFWRTKGKRIAAWLMIALIIATTIPFGSISASADDSSDLQADGTIVTVTGTVLVPNDTGSSDSNGNETAYQGAEVRVVYQNGGTAKTTSVATTDEDGKFTITIADWTLQENDTYSVSVKPQNEDIDKYDEYTSGNKTITLEQLNSKIVEIGQITLGKKKTAYSVMAKSETTDGSDASNAGNVEVSDNIVTATPIEGYEITNVTVMKNKKVWVPDNTETEWWESYLQDGVFTYNVSKDKNLDSDYEFIITFAKKQFIITYKISQNGKLILNSESDTDKVEITTSEGEKKVSYTDAEYKIKAAVTDNKYHLTSFKVDGYETLTADINNELNDFEYTFPNGIKQAHNIEVTVEIDTYTVSVTTNDGGIVTINGATEKRVEVNSGTEVTIVVKPEESKTVNSLSIDGNQILEEALKYTEDGTATYVTQSICKNLAINIVFADITNENQDTLINAGFLLADSENQPIVADRDGKYYATLAKLTSKNGEKISLSQWGFGTPEIKLSNTKKISEVYIGGYFNKKKVTFEHPVTVVIDSDRPELTLTDTEKTIWTTEETTQVTLSGKASDTNLSRVVWSRTELKTNAEILDATDEAILDDGHRFTIENVELQNGQNQDTFYIYAIDKAKQCSEAGVVTVYRDSAAPVITRVSLIPADTIRKYDFGNYYNGNITLQVTANDVDSTDKVTSGYPASGVKEVLVYGNDETKCYVGNVSAMVTGTANSADIEVTITLDVAGEFANLTDIHIKVKDEVGNTSQVYKLTNISEHVDIVSDKLMLEKDAPKLIGISQVEGRYEKTDGSATEYWYNAIPEISYIATDRKNEINGSGLGIRKIVLNGTEIASCTNDFTIGVTDSPKIAQEDKYTVTTDKLVDMSEGENTVVTTYTDIAGNKTIDTKTICLDTHKPDVTRFNIEKKDASKILNILTFGNYGNGVIKVTVTADDLYSDDGSEVPSAGLNEITLYVGEEAYQTKAVGSDNTAVFELPAETVLNEQKVYLDKKISTTVTDNVGNQSEKTLVTTANSNVKNSNLMIETVKPIITSVLSAEGYVGKNGIIYNNSDTGVSIKVEDKDSGIYNVKASVNNKELVNVSYPDQKTVTESYEINTKDAVINADTNRYDMVITAIDNAGNEYSKTQRVYKDITAPEILSIDMQAAGNKEADGSVSYTEADYGYYFVENTKVTVTATDGSKEGDSGVKEIHYYTVDANGTKSSEQIVQADAEGKVTFVVQAGFKGQIYACAYDMLNNHEERYVTPSSLIIETAEQHAREKHIDFNKAAAASKDAKGNELYEKDVTVDVTVTDTFSGIRSVEWTVESPYDKENNQSGNVEISNQGAFSSGNADGWSQTKKDKNLVTELKKSFTVKNNSNEIKMHIKMTDRAGNTSEDELIFSIDKTKPEIKIAFDNETPDAENTTMFKENRVATITVTERNFEAADFKADITNTDGVIPELSAWQTTENTENPDQSVSTATITFAEDGDYTLSVSGQDKAANQAETVKADDFTIDKTRPVITVTYDNNNAVNGNYYAATRTATIQIEEHNFSENRVRITGTATDNGAGISFPQSGGFTGNGDVHTATITCGTDGLYNFNVEYTDMAGNIAETYTGEEYYVDLTEPEIEIVGVEDYSANNGDVIPQIVMSDTNFDTNGVNIELVGANQGSVAPEGSYTNQGNGETFTFQNFPKEQSYDDIYTINATLTDMAGNESNATVTFSVNRFGSVYVFDQTLKDIEGTYIQNEIDVKLKEVNVDSLEHDKIKVVVDANGTPRTLEEGIDYQVQESGGNGQWYQYDYTIDKSLFAGDGRYIVTLYSEDIAGNVNENIDESKEAEISFGVDKTAPVVIPIDVESNAQYPVDTKAANVTVNDNLVLDSVEIYIGDKKCDYTVDGENYQFNIPNNTKKQDVTIMAVDAAGNKTNYVLNGILVTTNTFIRWYNNKPLFAGSIAGAAVVTGGGVGAAIALRSGRIKIRRKRK